MTNQLVPQLDNQRRNFLKQSGLLCIASLLYPAGLSNVLLANIQAAPKPLWQDAVSLCEDLQKGHLSSVELMENIYARIEHINPIVNAIVNLLPKEKAIKLAKAKDRVPLNKRGPLHGLPMALKDAVNIKGFPTTFGSKLFEKNTAKKDDELAIRLRKAGAIFIGHTNMPEFGLGSHTFNEVFGMTKNPYNLSKSCGGSSGGAAVSLATMMLPLADGSDMGGSLRNPASFCNVVGFRPSIGRMPKLGGGNWHGRLTTTGPMARTVKDTAFLFSIMAGPDPRDPLTLPEPGTYFFNSFQKYKINPQNPLKIAISPDLGFLPVDKKVSDIIYASKNKFKQLGAKVYDVKPPLKYAMEAFYTQRALRMRLLGEDLNKNFKNWKQKVKSTALWNIQKGFE